MSAIANAGIGIWLTSGSGTLIGGAAAGEGNQISGNASHGIAISQAAGSRIHGNLIGTDASGTGPLGNGQNGVNVDSSGHTVGGAGAGQGNVIAFNGISGVGVGFGNGNALRANSIHSNLRMGIDLYPFAGPTANDDGDEDAGGNDLQNSPILTRAVLTPTNVLVRGTFNSRPNIDYVLDFYAKPTCDSSGLGQGRSWLGATRVTTDVAGNALFNASVGAVPGASVLAATATDANGSTSEFSWCLPINTNGIADLVLTRTVSAGSVLAGQPITYVLTVSNAGPHSADNVWLSLWLTASGLTGCSAEVSQGTVGPDGDSWYASLGPIAVGGSATLRLTVIPTDIQTILDYGTVLLDQYDPEPGNNSTSGSVTSAPGPGVLEFSAARFVARESGGVAAISVTRRGGDAGPVSVDYATSDLTAVGGLDYIAAAGTLVFASGEVAKTFTVLIQDDALPECNKELLLTLLHPAGGAVVLGQTSATLAIVDDEVGPRRSLELVSVDTNSPPRAGNGHSSEGVASSSGEFVAFSSLARNLSASGGSAFVQNVFVRDRVHHTTRLISASTNGTGGASGSSSPRISGDGRFVAFASRAPDLVAGDVNDGTDIFLRDVLLETTRLVSVNRAGSGSANAPSYEPEMTPDGRFVVFESPATDLASNDSNGAKHDIYLRDMTQPAAELISLNSAGTGSGDGDSFQPAVSADGRYVVFQSFASNLAGTGGGWPQIYLRDRAAGSNILCSVESNHAGGGNGYSSGAALSAQGQVVAFQSDATDMVAGDTNDTRDVFIFDARSREVGLVSMNASGSGSGNGGSYSPVLSADGRYVAFFSYATDLVAGLLPGSTGQVFVRDLLAGTTALVSVNCDGTGGGNADSEFPSISADGRFVAFRSSASDLVSGEFPPSSANVYRRDLVSGSTVLVSRSQDGSGGGGSYSLRASVSPDGGTVTFDSLAPDLVSNDGNGEGDVFVWQAASAGAPDINAVISLRRIAGGALTVAVAGRPGGAYRLQRTTSLATSGLWSSLVTTNAPADGRFEFLDPAPPPSSAFYRVLRQ